jgi:phosphohistidine phosphatase
MRRIILVRHAKAKAATGGGSDFARPLRKKGKREARTMAEWYGGIAEPPDAFLSSPADRALETARIFAKVLGYPPGRIVLDDGLYDGPAPDVFLEALAALDNAKSSVMVFGHNPEFSEFANYLVEGFEDNLPKASVFGVSLDCRSWRRIPRGRWEVELYESPGGLDSKSAGS